MYGMIHKALGMGTLSTSTFTFDAVESLNAGLYT